MNHNFMTLAFNFLDYDQNGSIGSVDILNLKKSVETKGSEEVLKVFLKESVSKQFGSKLGKLTSGIQASIEIKNKNKKAPGLKQKGAANPLQSILSKKTVSPPAELASNEDLPEEKPKKVTVLEDLEDTEPEKEESADEGQSEGGSSSSSCIQLFGGRNQAE